MRTRHPFPDVDLEYDEIGLADALSSSGRTFGFDPDNAGSNPASATMIHQHQGENRTQRRAAVANWVPPIGEKMPTRRELLHQRQRQRRGKLDIETRRLQRKATK